MLRKLPVVEELFFFFLLEAALKISLKVPKVKVLRMQNSQFENNVYYFIDYNYRCIHLFYVADGKDGTTYRLFYISVLIVWARISCSIHLPVFWMYTESHRSGSLLKTPDHSKKLNKWSDCYCWIAFISNSIHTIHCILEAHSHQVLNNFMHGQM